MRFGAFNFFLNTFIVCIIIKTMNISKKDSESIQNGILRYQKILASAKARDLNESDTVTIITDMLNSRKNFLRNFFNCSVYASAPRA